MSNPKVPASRISQARSESKKIPLRSINVAQKEKYCHRNEKAFEDAELKPLIDNIVIEGLRTPLTVYAGEPIGTYVLIGGFRRHAALWSAIKKSLDRERLHDNMLVDAVILEPAAGQSEAAFMGDLISLSVTENEQRKHFDDEERLRIVALFDREKLPAPRGASALALSFTQYDRLLKIVQCEWLHRWVVENCIGLSHAADLIQKAEKNRAVDALRQALAKWIEQHRKKLDKERENKAKLGKVLTGSAACVKKYFTSSLVKHWVECMTVGKPIQGEPKFRFGIEIGSDSITVPGGTHLVKKMTAADLELMIGELQDATELLVPLMTELEHLERCRKPSAEELTLKLAAIREDRLRQKEAVEAAEAGRPAEGFDDLREDHLADLDLEDDADGGSAAGTATNR